MKFAKGHGTGNDFVIVPDPDGVLDLTPELVAALCDRRRGIGGDGVLRVVREGDGWFMDYRNADGSLAEMCGNGARVFVRYLLDNGLDAGSPIPIRTRAGDVVARVEDEIAVGLQLPRVYGESTATLDTGTHAGVAVDIGNPHLVCAVPDVSALDLTSAPIVDPDLFPNGTNVEFVEGLGSPRVRMRVHERGVGETLSCGTGAGAVAAVALRALGADTGTVTVDVPGGRLTVTVDGEACWLAGPAVVVAYGEVDLAALVDAALQVS